jgi:hypothetical protein
MDLALRVVQSVLTSALQSVDEVCVVKPLYCSRWMDGWMDGCGACMEGHSELMNGKQVSPDTYTSSIFHGALVGAHCCWFTLAIPCEYFPYPSLHGPKP